MAKGKSGAAKAKKSKKTGKGTTTVPEEPIVKSVRENLLSVAQRAADEFGVPADELLDATFSAVSEQAFALYATLDPNVRKRIDEVLASGALARLLSKVTELLAAHVAGAPSLELVASVLSEFDLSETAIKTALDRAAKGEYGPTVQAWTKHRAPIERFFAAISELLSKLKGGQIGISQFFDGIVENGSPQGAMSIMISTLANAGVLGSIAQAWATDVLAEGVTRLQRRFEQAVGLFVRFGPQGAGTSLEEVGTPPDQPRTALLVEMADAGLTDLILDISQTGAFGPLVQSMARDGQLQSVLDRILSPGLSVRFNRLAAAWQEFADAVRNDAEEGDKKKERPKGKQHPAVAAIEVLFIEAISFLGSGEAGAAARRMVIVPEALDSMHAEEGPIPDDKLREPFGEIGGSIKAAGSNSFLKAGLDILTSNAISNQFKRMWSGVPEEPEPGEVLYRITVRTSPNKNGLSGTGTDANVEVKVIGNKGETKQIKLAKSGNRDKFRGGQEDVFVARAKPVGNRLKAIVVSHDNSGLFTDAAWHVETINVEVFVSAKLKAKGAFPKLQTRELFSGNRWISKKDGLTATLAPISAATSDFSDTTKRKAKVARLLERGDDAALEVANVLLKKHKVSVDEVVGLLLALDDKEDPVVSPKIICALFTAVSASKKHKLVDLLRALIANARRVVAVVDVLLQCRVFGSELAKPGSRTTVRSVLRNCTCQEGQQHVFSLAAIGSSIFSAAPEARIAIFLGPTVCGIHSEAGDTVDPLAYFLSIIDYRQSPALAWAIDLIAETGVFGSTVQTLAERGTLSMTPDSVIHQFQEQLAAVVNPVQSEDEDDLDGPCPPGVQLLSVGTCILALQGALGDSLKAQAESDVLQNTIAKYLQVECRARVGKVCRLLLEAVGQLRRVPPIALKWKYGCPPPPNVNKADVEFGQPAQTPLKDGEVGINVLTVSRKLIQVPVPATATVRELRNLIVKHHKSVPADDRRVRYAPIDRFIRDKESLDSVGVTTGSCVRLCRKLPPICLDIIHELEKLAETGVFGDAAEKFFNSFVFVSVEEALDVFAHGFIGAVFDGDSDAEQDADMKRARRRDMMRSICSRVMILHREATQTMLHGQHQISEEEHVDIYIQDITPLKGEDGKKLLKPALIGLLDKLRQPPVNKKGVVNPAPAKIRQIFKRQGIWVNNVYVVVKKRSKKYINEVTKFPPPDARLVHSEGTNPREFSVGKRSARVAVVLTKTTGHVEYEHDLADDSEDEQEGETHKRASPQPPNTGTKSKQSKKPAPKSKNKRSSSKSEENFGFGAEDANQ